MSIPIIVCGAAGRMGNAILRCAIEDPEFEIVGGVEQAKSPAIGGTVGAVIGKPGLTAPVTASPRDLPGAENCITIHFTSPEATIAQLAWSIESGAPAVIGTTGFDAEQRVMIEQAASRVPIVFAPNMSVGVNTLFKIVGEVARILGEGFDVEIAEMHHRFKKDAPSGTARRLAEIIAQAGKSSYEDLVVHGRSGMPGERPAREIGIHALRGGDVVGEHTVTFAALGERVELTHRAHSRDTFARGALRAAKWIQDRKPGLYSMQDVLGIR
jgi:4-hydroxy-tetrahydrodipicolinate reductase